MAYCSLICTPESFRPSDCSHVRWLDWENDYLLARAYWHQDPPLLREAWEQNRAEGFRYCASLSMGQLQLWLLSGRIRRLIGKWLLLVLLQLLVGEGVARRWSAL